jgi:hypothetical protein
MSAFVRKRARSLIAIGLALVTSLSLAYWYLDRCSADGPTCAAVESAATRAMIVDSTMDVPGAFSAAAEAIAADRDPQTVDRALPNSPTRSGNATRPQVLQHLRDVRTLIEHTFTGPALSTELSTFDQISSPEPDAWSLGGGIGRIKVKSVEVTGDSAIEKARVETWQRQQPYRDVDGNWRTAEPHSEVDAVLTLTRDDAGNWLVERYSWEFVPGHGP